MPDEKKKDLEETLRTLPSDDVRAIMWGYDERYDYQMLVQSSRGVARGLVARLVADGARNTHEWTEAKNEQLKAFDESGITAAFLDSRYGGYLEGPKNLAMALIAFELAWVDAGAATCSLCGNLGLAPIHERGTDEQREYYMKRGAPPAPGEDRKMVRGAFALTEPLPYVGVETGILSGKVRVAEWKEGEEPILQVEKRGRFITNMGFANYISVAVASDDKRIKSSCMIVIEDTDPGVFDRGAPVKKMVHQLSSTNDPVFNLKVPASRIIGGYTVKDGVIIPRHNHGEVIEAVFKRTRVTIALMSSAKLLSAVEPVIRYQRQRFRGGADVNPGTLRYDLGLQQRDDCLHRLAAVWATGEAGASMGFETCRVFDVLDPLEKEKDRALAEKGVRGSRAEMKALAKLEKDAMDLLELKHRPEGERDEARLEKLQSDPLIHYLEVDSLANVLCPAGKLWNTGDGADMMREAVAMMGGYGITEDCPGFLGAKWMDIQLEATYEGPEAVQRRQLSLTMLNPLFLARMRLWIGQLGKIEGERPGMAAGLVAATMEMWLWTLDYLQKKTDSKGAKLYHGARQSITFPMADAVCWVLASRSQIMDVIRLSEKGPNNPAVAEGLAGLVSFFSDLCVIQAVRGAGKVGGICAELVCGGKGEQPPAEFVAMRAKMDGLLAGSREAKDRAASALTQVMIPEVLGYPI